MDSQLSHLGVSTIKIESIHFPDQYDKAMSIEFRSDTRRNMDRTGWCGAK